MSASPAASPPKYKLCPKCRHIYPAASNFCPQDQTALVVSDDIIAGRYILSQMVGAGAMGKVYRAEDTQLGRTVALKLLNPAQDAHLRIDREAKAGGALDHDNVVRVYERGQHDDGRVYIAMEFLEGESLRQLLATQGKLPMKQALDLWLQAVRGVAAAHKKGIVHRDLKPDNLFLARREQDDGTIEQLKVLDFGIAQLRSDRPTRGTMRIGTPGYVAPEQWQHGEATARSDVYSLGVILLEMLTGRRSMAANPQAPIEAFERFALQQTLSPALTQLAGEVLAPDPLLRPENARVLLDRLRRLPDSQLWSAAAGGVPRESPAPVSQASSGDEGRRVPRSSEELQPLSVDDEEGEDTEQIGIDALRLPPQSASPAPLPAPLPPGVAGQRLHALDQPTVRVDRLPGLVSTPTPERPTAGLPDRARIKAVGRTPEPVAEPVAVEPAAAEPAAVIDLVTDQVTGQVSDSAIEAVTDERTAKQPVMGPSELLPLPVQSTLVLTNPAALQTLNLPALPPLEPVETRISPSEKSPVRRASPAATMVSRRSNADTVTSGVAPTLPIGMGADSSWLVPGTPPENAMERVRAFLRSPTALGPVSTVLALGLLLGLVIAVVVYLFLRFLG